MARTLAWRFLRSSPFYWLVEVIKGVVIGQEVSSPKFPQSIFVLAGNQNNIAGGGQIDFEAPRLNLSLKDQSLAAR